MKTKRGDVEDTTDREEQHSKNQKLIEKSSPSPPQLGFDNALLPLASYDDDDEGDGKKAEENGRNNLDTINRQEEEEDDDEEDRNNGFGKGRRNRMIESRRDCPYLDTVNRQVLGFDFERFCLVSLSNLNVYACLVCVNFPVKNLELKDYIPLPTPKEEEKLRSKYDLIANIVQDGKPGEGSYRVFVQRKSEELWYEMQDLHVAETLPQMVALSEAYMQIYEQQRQQQPTQPQQQQLV